MSSKRTLQQRLHQFGRTPNTFFHYLLKGGSIAFIRETIHEEHRGASCIDPQLSRIVLDALCHGNKSEEKLLSPREIEVLELLAQGFSKKEVADQLGLSYHTVALYVRNIFKKLETPILPPPSPQPFVAI